MRVSRSGCLFVQIGRGEGGWFRCNGSDTLVSGKELGADAIVCEGGRRWHTKDTSSSLWGGVAYPELHHLPSIRGLSLQFETISVCESHSRRLAGYSCGGRGVLVNGRTAFNSSFCSSGYGAGGCGGGDGKSGLVIIFD